MWTSFSAPHNKYHPFKINFHQQVLLSVCVTPSLAPISLSPRRPFRSGPLLCRCDAASKLLHPSYFMHYVVTIPCLCLSNAMHGQNINLPVCVCVSVCVSVTLSVNSPTGQTPQRIFTADSLKDVDLCKDVQNRALCFICAVRWLNWVVVIVRQSWRVFLNHSVADVWANVMACYRRATCHIAGCCRTWRIHCHDSRATCHIAGCCYMVNSMTCPPRATCHVVG